MASDDNPFAEAGDDDRTVILPLPRPQSTASEPGARSAAATNATSGGAAADAGLIPTLAHASPIVAAAAPVLSLMIGLRALLAVPDPGALRLRAVEALRRYEQALRGADIPADQIRVSHYALCASLDDVVQNTPWGSTGPWANASLVSTFHQEVRSGDRFFDVLARLRENPGRFLPALELMYLCLSLGMQGRYRLSRRGPAELDRVREDTYLVILRLRGACDPALSPHWRGVTAPYRRPGREVPLTLAALGACGLLGLLYVLALTGLNGASDRLFGRVAGLPPSAMPTIVRTEPPRPVPPPPHVQSPRDRLAHALAPQLAQGAISLTGTDAAPVIRLQSTGLFASGSATLQPASLPLLAHLADALRSAAAQSVRIVGYTDDQPIHTAAFPSNFELSSARADAAADVLRAALGGVRIETEGRADADPIDTNATPAGRQHNRRIEIEARIGTTP